MAGVFFHDVVKQWARLNRLTIAVHEAEATPFVFANKRDRYLVHKPWDMYLQVFKVILAVPTKPCLAISPYTLDVVQLTMECRIEDKEGL